MASAATILPRKVSIAGSRENVSCRGCHVPVAGRAAGVQFGVSERFHIGTGLAAAGHSTEGDDLDVAKGMAAGAGTSRAANRLANFGHGGVTAKRRWPPLCRTPQLSICDSPGVAWGSWGRGWGALVVAGGGGVDEGGVGTVVGGGGGVAAMRAGWKLKDGYGWARRRRLGCFGGVFGLLC